MSKSEIAVRIAWSISVWLFATTARQSGKLWYFPHFWKLPFLGTIFQKWNILSKNGNAFSKNGKAKRHWQLSSIHALNGEHTVKNQWRHQIEYIQSWMSVRNGNRLWGAVMWEKNCIYFLLPRSYSSNKNCKPTTDFRCEHSSKNEMCTIWWRHWFYAYV